MDLLCTGYRHGMWVACGQFGGCSSGFWYQEMSAAACFFTQDISMQSMTKYQPAIMKLMSEFMDDSKREIERMYKR